MIGWMLGWNIDMKGSITTALLRVVTTTTFKRFLFMTVVLLQGEIVAF
jgi:hypothetical protein